MKSQQEIQQILDDSKLQSEYRRKLSDAIKMAVDYHGTETEYKELFKTLIELEDWLREVFGTDDGSRFPTELEEEISEKWNDIHDQRKKIDDVLGISAKSLDDFIDRSLEDKEPGTDDLDGICKVDLGGVILPTNGDVTIQNGSGNGFEGPRFQARLKNLLVALENNGIFTDDVVLARGWVEKNMMRKVSYAIIEIPKMNREILVCDQVGEATFVIYGIMGRKTLLSENKENLRGKYGARVVRVIYSNPGQWESEVLGHLFKDVDVDKLEKVNVRERESLRAEILKRKPTAEEWADMGYFKEKLSFEIAGMKLRAIAKTFGIEGDPIGYRKLFLELGRKIYGDEHECLQYYADLPADELRVMIMEKIPTPEEWISLDKKGKDELKIARMGICAIASIFGVNGNPAGNYSIYLRLGRKIYGEDHRCLKDLNLERLKRRIIEKIPTAEEWAKMEQVDARGIRIGKMKLNAIARQFGIEGSPTSYNSVFIALGREIYDDDHGYLQEITPDELRVKILEKMPTAEEWAGMGSEERINFRIANMSLRTIATKFSIQGSPVQRLSVHFELGMRLYGEDTECLKMFIVDELRNEILKEMPNAEEWAGMTSSDRRSFKIGRMKLIAIARVFGITGNPLQAKVVHLELGRKIYGEEHECLKEITLDKLKDKILEKIPTAEEWAVMCQKEKKEFKIAGMGLHAIASQFSMDGSPVHTPSIHFELGRKIYGEDTECLNELTLEDLRIKIIEEVPTFAEWVGLSSKKRRAIEIGRLKLNAIARQFGVTGSPLQKKSIHIELGKKIYEPVVVST